MKLVRTLELARTGEWGQDGAPITRRDLAEIVETFAGRPPLTVGHIPRGQKEGPRYGQVLSVGLAEKGNTLTGRVEFGDAANTAYTAGEYDGWSVSIPRRGKDGKRYLHHLALLGETPPKIPGLRDFGGLPTANYEYADGDQEEAYSFEGALKEVEVTMDPQKELEELKKKLAALEADNKKLLEEKAEREKAAAAKEAPEAKAPESVPPAAPAVEGREKPKDDFSDRLARAEKELQKSRVDAFMAKAGEKLPQGLRDKAKALAEQLAGSDEPFNFSDNGKTAQGKALGLLGELFLQWPDPVKTGSGGFDFADESGKGADWGKVAAGM
ncbi:MAG: hypothetical protein LBP69_06455 [Treponema sp.]|jgi:hypothetical protein|nr:hypothetical protein [Treponema sp.]